MDQVTIEVQTRSESHRGKWPGLNFFPSVAGAYQAWVEDQTIWKISWDTHRFLRKRVRDLWNPDEEATLRAMSSDYRTATVTAPSAIFWVDQDASTNQIFEVLRNVDFREKYAGK